MLKSLDERQIEPLMLLLRPSVAEEDPEPRLPQSLTAGVVDRAAAAPSQGFIRGGLPPRVLRRIRDHVDANIEQRISVEALARLANLSVCYFVRAFKRSVGLTPHDYLIRRRVERTMEMLSHTNLSLSEIALAVGFADQSHCARRFRQHVGMSPRDYRWSIP
ncbi:helix-turn-helix transcriptional regulator [Bradyrhizobium sp. Pear76]|uniref:helix-turn-helix domain-containing protein n=1 Tax=Bradyrhizobium oropedii TaxID=1571201 RepID=UPI001E3B11FA|nr:AraC family transcriptional regulator [Bradyrhizobium oropedii]MCC8963876.1 helix-turn-helix transcriptional regulator [Bradyrhizobium oropedii]